MKKYVVYWKNSKSNVFRDTFKAKDVHDLRKQMECIMLNDEIITDIYRAE